MTTSDTLPQFINYGHKPWILVKLRKANKYCDQCGKKFIGGEMAYRPLSESNGVARWQRLCLKCGSKCKRLI